MDYGAIDTLGLAFSAYLDDLGYLHTFNFVLRHFTLDTFMPSILPEFDHYLLLSHTSHHDTWHHIPLSIRMRCRSVFNHFGCAFIHLLDFMFNIFYDGRAWQIVDLVVTIIFILTVGILSVDLFTLCILSTDHYCCYSLVSFVLSAWCHDTWSCLALPIWGWTFSLHDNVITWWMNIF